MNAPISSLEISHFPVMLNEVINICSPEKGASFIDCTFGGGGYSEAILQFSGTRVIAIDRDKITEKYANALQERFPKRFNFFKEKFSNIIKIVKKNTKPKAIIFDLGISSFQLADEKRSFSFNSKNYLNMEMGKNKCSAYDVVNNFSKEDLSEIIKTLGEEKDGKIIANKIDKYRKKKPIETSNELASIVSNAKKSKRDYKK